MKLKLLLLIGILACGVTYAATQCSLESYVKACQNCPVDSYGKMNQTCYEKYQEEGKTCIALNHPILASKYKEGKCPQIDTCTSELETCKSGVSTGNDTADCKNFLVEACFKESDQCVAKAVEDCGGGLDMSDLWGLLHMFCPFVVMFLSLLLIGAVYAEHKRLAR
jgi:hypothetical protein